MSDRPTPETDALEQKQSSEGCPQWNDMMRWVREHAALARKLERERDEAREDATNYFAKVGELIKERDDALSQIVKAECRAERFCQERDDAREALREIQAADWKTSGELRGMAREALKAK